MKSQKGIDDTSEPPSMESFVVDDSEQEIGLMGQQNGMNKQPSGANRSHGRRRSRRENKFAKAMIVLIIPVTVIVALLLVVITSRGEPSKSASPAAPTGSEYPSGFDMKQNWGSYSPYFEGGANYGDVKSGTPHDDAQLRAYKQVHVLHRHADRYPAGTITRKIQVFVDKLNSMDEPPNESLSWILDWNNTLGQDLLTMKGVATEFAAGARFWSSHGRILYKAEDNLQYHTSLNVFDNGTARPIPVLRATDQSRIQTSARAWAAGFFGVYGGQEYSPVDGSDLYTLVLQRESDSFNSTLAPYYSCPKNSGTGKEHEMNWINTYMVDASVRLQKLLPGIHNLTTVDAFAMQAICTFEYAADNYSPFCSLFTETEWRGFEYANDLKFYGESSFGSPTGAAEGAGWLSELVARLEDTRPEVGNGVNVTENSLVPNEQLFYLDMTHDSVIVSVLTALGLEFLKPELPDTKIPVPRQFIISRLTPFGANLLVEVLEDDNIRMKLNNRIVPLNSLSDCSDNEFGLCPRDKFVTSVKKAIQEIDYVNACY